MHPRNIALAACSVVVLGALVLLVVKVNASPDIEVPEDKLAQARERHARNQSSAQIRRRPSAPTPSSEPPSSPLAPRPRPSHVSEGEGEAPPPARTLPPTSNEEFNRSYVTPGSSPATGDIDNAQDAKRNEIRELYDQGNYESALEAAKAYLRETPGHPYVMRVAVTSACASGDGETARSYYTQMSDMDKRVVAARCSRFGFQFDQ